ncbi:hypothetical protein D3C86_1934920 [compost metagenome]
MAEDGSLRLLSHFGSQVILLVEALGAGAFQNPHAHEAIQWVVLIAAQDFQ